MFCRETIISRRVVFLAGSRILGGLRHNNRPWIERLELDGTRDEIMESDCTPGAKVKPCLLSRWLMWC